MSTYADTCFFVSLYLSDAHTREVERRLASHPDLWMTPLHRAEWMHTIEQHVFRKSLSQNEADQLIQRFKDHNSRGLWREAAMPDQCWDACEELARRYTGRVGVRTLDTLHVACALELKAMQFWTFDQRQAELARAVGLKTS